MEKTFTEKVLKRFEVLKQQYKIEGAMTLRRCFYILVGKGMITNKLSSYQDLSKKLKKARLLGYIPYKYIIDTGRNIYKRNTYSIFDEAFKELCKNYKKDSMSLQNKHIEVWIEKEAIANVIYPLTYPYDISLVVSKGFTSVTFLYEASKRFKECGKDVIILFVSDFDCEGEYIPKVVLDELENNHSCKNITIKKVLLNHNDIETYGLISNKGYKIKERQKGKAYVRDFIDKYGEVQYELDALPTPNLKKKITEAILDEIDVEVVKKSDEESISEVEEWKKENLKEDK